MRLMGRYGAAGASADLSRFERLTRPPFFNNISFLRRDHFSFRYEYKYFITREIYEKLRQRIKPFFEIDRHCHNFAQRAYPVRSIYWDTESLTCYNQKIDGIMHRYKYRYRIYLEKLDHGLQLYLEVKGKDEKKIVKYRTAIRWTLLRRLREKEIDIGQTGLPYEGQRELSSFLEWEKRMSLRPVMAVRYEREAYQYRRDDKIRINFDQGIYFKRAHSINDLFADIFLWQKMDLANLIIFEIKIKSHHVLPSELKAIIIETSLQAESISKYCYAVDHSGLITGAKGLKGGEKC